jgi:hypothetical protein
MDPVTAKIRTPDSCLADDESGFEPEQELASSICRHFGALADVLSRTAEQFGDSAEGERLRAAASAARRGASSADRLYAKISECTADPAAMQRRA